MKLKHIVLSSLSAITVATPTITLVACNKDEVKVSDTEAYKGKTLSKDFKIPEGTKVIGKSAFENAKLPENFTIPEGVTTIKDSAFEGVTFPKNFRLPKSITTIESGSFAWATFQTTLNWPKEVTKLPRAIFYQTKFLRAEDPKKFPNEEGVHFPEGITDFGDHSFYHVKFPAGFRVSTTLKYVGPSAFASSDFTNVSKNFDFPKDMHYQGAIKAGGGSAIFNEVKGMKFDPYDVFLRGKPTFEAPGPKDDTNETRWSWLSAGN